MRILCYINTLGRGGAERVLTNLATSFAEENNEVIFVTSYPVEKEYRLDQKIYRINLSNTRINGNAIKRNFRYISKLRSIIKQSKPDICLSFMAEPNFRLLMATKGLKQKKIISIRNDPEREYSGLAAFLAKILFTQADGIVFQTKDAKAWFSTRIQKKSAIIYNKVDDKFYKKCISDYSQCKDIVTVGRLTNQKNHKLLIEAFANIKDEINDDLYIYGDGPLKEQLLNCIRELKIEDRVHLMGISNEIEEQLPKYKLFVLPSDYEGMPNSLMEAMAVGNACISADCPCGGPRELFGEEGEKFLFEVHNVEQLTKLTREMLFDRDKLQRNADLMKARSNNFTGEKIYKNWKEYFEKVYYA